MTNFTQSRLKYICTSYNSNISTDKLKECGEYPVFGAAGVMGYSDNFRNTCEYLGIIKDGAGIGRINLYPAKSSLLGTMAYILPNKDIDICWLKYCIVSLNLEVSLDKTTIPHIYFSEYGNKTIFCPPLEIQKSIANFLDKKCSEIDSLSADIQSQIDVLEEYKKSIITEAVTKGLNPDVEMKDSGIEWAQQIPKHWGIMPNKFVMRKEKVLCPKYAGEDILSLTMNGVIVRDLDAGGKMPASFDGYQIVKPNNLLMCLFDYDVTPRCIGLIKNHGLTSPAYSQFVMKNDNSERYYYYYYLMIDNTKELLHLAKNLRHSFTEEQLGMINTPVPPINEQISIADHLDKIIAETDMVIVDKKAQLETLAEYKKSLIYEYVTGKKEVSTI